MNKQGILQVRVDRDLARDLDAEVRRAAAVDTNSSESAVVRCLLREAVAARHGRAVLPADQGYREGWLRGFGEAKRVMQQAAAKSEPFERPAKRERGGAPW